MFSCRQHENISLIETSKIDEDTSIYDPIIDNKIVFFVVGKNIDFNQIDTKNIIREVLKERYLEIKSASKQEISDPFPIIKVYTVEDITCGYLKKHFSDHKPSDIVYEYDNKLLVKTGNGIIKIYHEHVNQQ